MAIVEGLDDQLQWPNEQHRAELANVFQGIFNGCIGVNDVKEYQVVKFQDPVKERHSWSGKKKINSYKCLSVIDHSGWFIFVRITLGNNDREVYTTSPLYLCEGNYFSEGEFVLAMVPLRATVNFFVCIKTLAMIRIKFFLAMLSGNYTP
jgi:hypothetical protein